MTMRVVLAGDSALIIELEERIDPDVNARAVAVANGLAAAAIPGVRDVAPAYCSVAVYFDPLTTDFTRLTQAIEAQHAAAENVRAVAGAAVVVPVCYGGRFGPDLSDVAQFAESSEDDVIARHAGRLYHVYMLGFVPGFAYMGSVDARIAVPRLTTPRTAVPAGSVGIAGVQTGVYPSDTPGGWRLIGRTPIPPFDPRRAAPFLFQAGDAVRFTPITEKEFRDWTDVDRARLQDRP